MRERNSATGRAYFQQNGFSILPDVFGEHETESLIESISKVENAKGSAAAARYMLSAICSIYHQRSTNWRILRGFARSSKTIFRALHFRGTLFDKTAGPNWLVPWHQDLTICVVARVDLPNYGPWTIKAGICHVQPPPSILENMLSVRIHLDDCDESNGALRVLPGTYTFGRLTPEQIAERQRSVASIPCVVRRGGLVLMRPLLLHASSAASKAVHRRVIHIDYATSQLDGGLQWATTEL